MRLVENTPERFEVRHQPWLAAALVAGWIVAFLAGGLYSIVSGIFLNLVPMLAGVAVGAVAWHLLARPRRLVADAQAGEVVLTVGRQVQRWPLGEIAGARCAKTLVRKSSFFTMRWAALDFADGRPAEQVWSGPGEAAACRMAATLNSWISAYHAARP